jgi:hypothetical protein
VVSYTCAFYSRTCACVTLISAPTRMGAWDAHGKAGQVLRVVTYAAYGGLMWRAARSPMTIFIASAANAAKPRHPRKPLTRIQCSLVNLFGLADPSFH